MTFLLLLAAMAVIGGGLLLRKRSEGSSRAVIGIGVLGLIAVAVLQARQTVFPSRPKTDNSAMALSYCLATSMFGDMQGKSGRVVLLFPQPGVMDHDMEGNFVNGFRVAMRHGGRGLALKDVHLEGGADDPSSFKRALAEAPDAIAVVSYAGAPAGLEKLYPPGQEGPLFYVFDAKGTTDWLAALKGGRIRAVAVPRPGVQRQGQESAAGTPETIFDQFYLLATEENADDAAASLKAHK
jgi:hypothetical protein